MHAGTVHLTRMQSSNCCCLHEAQLELLLFTGSCSLLPCLSEHCWPLLGEHCWPMQGGESVVCRSSV